MKFQTTLLGLAALILSSLLYSQEPGKMLIISNVEARVMVDGELVGEIMSNQPKKFEVSGGEHYLQVFSIVSKSEKSEIINIESGSQKVLKFEFDEGSTDERILIAELDFDIPGLVTANAEEDFSYPSYLYAFEKGDEIILNLEMTNEKGTNVIEISTYPDGNIIYSNDSFQELENLKISVKERSIYVFTFASNHAFDRDVRLTIERVSKSDETKDFNTKVTWKQTYEVVQVQKPLHHFINSGSHAKFKGGKSRIAIPVNLPPNTVRWYYEFSAFRDKDKVEQYTSMFSLAGELSKLVDQTGLLEFGINQLTAPEGSDICDIYVLDHENSSLFTSKGAYQYYTEGSRENLASGAIEIQGVFDELVYLGIRNPSNMQGINVVVEVAAIVVEEDWMMEADE